MLSGQTPDIELSVSTEQVCFIVAKAREFEVKDLPTIADSGSNATDGHMVDVLEARANEPVAQEIRAFIDVLDEGEQIDFVALAWVGCGDFGIDEWQGGP